MKVSTKGRYALRLMADLAEYSKGSFIPLREISTRQDISMKYLEQIVNQLSRAGLLQSIRGAQGGYRLVRPPADYTAGEILRAAEGGLEPISCLTTDCPRGGDCLTQGFWAGLSDAIDQYVDSVTLEALLQGYHNKSKKEQKDG